MSKLAKIKNIGAKTSSWLHDVGVHDLADIETLGVITVYLRLKEKFPDKVTLNALWGLQGALLNISYTALPQSLKDDLLAELEAEGNEDDPKIT